MGAQDSGMVVERMPSQDLITDGWYFHQFFDRRLNENGYILPVTWFEITNSPSVALGERVMATEVFQVGDMALPRLMRLYQHLVEVHNKLLPTGPLRHRNPHQPRKNGRFVKASEITEE